MAIGSDIFVQCETQEKEKHTHKHTRWITYLRRIRTYWLLVLPSDASRNRVPMNDVGRGDWIECARKWLLFWCFVVVQSLDSRRRMSNNRRRLSNQPFMGIPLPITSCSGWPSTEGTRTNEHFVALFEHTALAAPLPFKLNSPSIRVNYRTKHGHNEKTQ